PPAPGAARRGEPHESGEKEDTKPHHAILLLPTPPPPPLFFFFFFFFHIAALWFPRFSYSIPLYLRDPVRLSPGIDYPVIMVRECNVSYVFSVPVPYPNELDPRGKCIFGAYALRFSEAVFCVSGICKANGVPQDKRLMRMCPRGTFVSIFPTQRVMISPFTNLLLAAWSPPITLSCLTPFLPTFTLCDCRS
ncbi:unnamed protein product, partial [Penicillium nalgiovense]